MFGLEDPGSKSKSLDSPYNFNDLDIDQAYLNVSSAIQQGEKLWLYLLSTNCHKCPFQREGSAGEFISGSGRIFKVSTKYPLSLRIRRSSEPPVVSHSTHDKDIVCQVGPVQPGEFGVYELQVGKELSSCEFQQVHAPVNIYNPLILLTLLFIIFLYKGVRLFRHVNNFIEKFLSKFRGQRKQNTVGEEEKSTNTETGGERLRKKSRASGRSKHDPEPGKRPLSSSQRLRFIDTFRGICIFFMILANDGGAGYTFLQHANWDGLTLADVIFPCFLWIMGVSIPIALRSQLKKQGEKYDRLKILISIARRSVKLIFLGLALNLFSMYVRTSTIDLSKIRLPGVLQRFGVTYFAAASFFILGSRKTGVGWIFITVLIAAHLYTTFFLPVSNCPTGYLGPGGLHKDGAYSPSCIGGAAGFIDRQILGENHMTRFPTAHSVYNPGGKGQPFDPEGILGTMTSLLQVWMGVQTGVILLPLLDARSQPQPAGKSKKIKSHPQVQMKQLNENLYKFFLFSAAASLTLGSILHFSELIPINKNLWSISFVLVTSGVAWLLLIFLYYIIEVTGRWDGSPFYEMGMNAMLLYVGHSMVQYMNCLPVHWSLRRMSTHTIRIVETLWGLSLWIFLALFLHHWKIYWVLR